MRYFDIEFLGSYTSHRDCPKGHVPEFAFIGRSNVGKSTLINSILNRKNVAFTSSTPGKTQTINLYNVNDSFIFTDLPGFGYAKTSKKERKKWELMIEGYLQNRENLICTFFLIDSRHPLGNLDRDMLIWFGERALPFVIVYTKFDKLNQEQKSKNIQTLRTNILEDWDTLPQEFITSGETGEGIEEIHTFVAQYKDVFIE